MFLQIVVHPDDRTYLHFIYRFDTSEAIQEFQFNRLPFGLSCSPFLAIRVLKQLVTDEGRDFLLAAKALMKHCYVDDILTGADSMTEAYQLQNELINLLKRGGFSLKKWASNSTSLLREVSETSPSSPISLANLEEPSIKVLGMQWDTQNDCLSYKVNVPDLTATKRNVMSIIARVYDPLGYLAPVVFKAKSILQELWRQSLDWDTPIPTETATEWERFYTQLPVLQTI